MDDTENHHLPSTSSETDPSLDPIAPTASEKRSIDENAEPHLSKRLRSSSSQVSPSTTDTQWIPPSKQLVIQLQSQASSLLQFTLFLIESILSSADSDLTEEYSRWLHSTILSYDPHSNNDKIDLLIQAAWKAAKMNLVR